MSMMLSLPSAYAAMGLRSPFEFALEQVGENEKQLVAFELLGANLKHAKIGATTWMCVNATIDIIEKKTVLMVGKNTDQGVELARLVRNFTQQKLGIEITLDGFSAAHIDFVSGGRLLSGVGEGTYKRAIRKFPEALIYRDAIWKNDLISRLKEGPQGTISFIESSDAIRWRGLDARFDFVMDLTLVGVLDLFPNVLNNPPKKERIAVRPGLF